MGTPPPTPSRPKLYSWVMPFLWWMIHRLRSCDLTHRLMMWPLVLMLYVPCIIIIIILLLLLLPFINQHLCTTLCLRNHLLVTTSMRFVLYWHHFQGDLPVNSSQHIQVIINACWPFIIRPQFFKHSWTALNIIEAPSSRHILYRRSFIDIQSCAAVFKKLRSDNKMVSMCL
jgi:hypothetical protein